MFVSEDRLAFVLIDPNECSLVMVTWSVAHLCPSVCGTEKGLKSTLDASGRTGSQLRYSCTRRYASGRMLLGVPQADDIGSQVHYPYARGLKVFAYYFWCATYQWWINITLVHQVIMQVLTCRDIYNQSSQWRCVRWGSRQAYTYGALVYSTKLVGTSTRYKYLTQ